MLFNPDQSETQMKLYPQSDEYITQIIDNRGDNGNETVIKINPNHLKVKREELPTKFTQRVIDSNFSNNDNRFSTALKVIPLLIGCGFAGVLVYTNQGIVTNYFVGKSNPAVMSDPSPLDNKKYSRIESSI
jgi:hypothetical protein